MLYFPFLNLCFSQNTNNGCYASGSWTNGKLQVDVGGINGYDITTGMSGGWEYSFTTTTDGRLEIKFDYVLDVSSAYESNEFGEAVVQLDGVDVVVKRLTGRSGTYYKSQVGEVIVFPYVGAGDHKITLGAHNNQKTTSDEDTKVTYDNVKVSLLPAE